ncbi:hypothetical protein GDO81_028925 [Engystomops pustulosus]|uniref:Uncharacterized protein n=1 Tax=Engystomops pustulosus TaxID=76066 RepID=A0AAV6YMQ0_ENGPU|nr:hypothetical protein GDO81_028925 [Engystomops pustulosus]
MPWCVPIQQVPTTYGGLLYAGGIGYQILWSILVFYPLRICKFFEKHINLGKKRFCFNPCNTIKGLTNFIKVVLCTLRGVVSIMG